MKAYQKNRDFVLRNIVDLGGPDPCWLWFGPGARHAPHVRRHVYESLEGPLNGQNMFQTCKTKNCVNPAHHWTGSMADFAQRYAAGEHRNRRVEEPETGDRK